MDEPGREYHLSTYVTDKNSSTEVLCEFFYAALADFDLDINNMILLLTDAVSYNTCFGGQIQRLYPHLCHFTCVSHLLHNITMKILGNFDNVMKVIKEMNTLMGYNQSFVRN